MKNRGPWIVVALVSILVVGGLAVPLAHFLRTRYSLPAAAAPLKLGEGTKSGGTGRPLGPQALTLAVAHFEGEGARRRIVGDVKNGSTHRATNVVVTLNLHVNSDSTVALAVARIPAIEPRATAHFETDPIPTPVLRFFVRSIDADGP